VVDNPSSQNKANSGTMKRINRLLQALPHPIRSRAVA
jgi:hypothetical protein